MAETYINKKNDEVLQIRVCICVYMWSLGRVSGKSTKKRRFSACVHFVHQQTGKVGLLYYYFHPGGLWALCLAYSMYPCCKDNDVMNGESEGESGRKRERDFKANAWGMSDKPVYV